MIDDFTPIIHTLPGRTIRCWAVSDVHIGAREADVEGFTAFLKRIEKDPDSYLCICGDVLNNGIKSSISDYEILPPSAQIEKAVELLTPMAGKILGCVGATTSAGA